MAENCYGVLKKIILCVFGFSRELSVLGLLNLCCKFMGEEFVGCTQLTRHRKCCGWVGGWSWVRVRFARRREKGKVRGNWRKLAEVLCVFSFHCRVADRFLFAFGRVTDALVKPHALAYQGPNLQRILPELSKFIQSSFYRICTLFSCCLL